MEFVRKLEDEDLFDRSLFYFFRARTASQEQWGWAIGCAQSTVGNWERGVTYPGRQWRRKILSASKAVLDIEKERIESVSNALNLNVRIDLVDTKDQLENSVLNAALTDFSYDEVLNRIVSVPFSTDDRTQDHEAFAVDKENLLESLAEQADLIVESIPNSANAPTTRLVSTLRSYKKSCASEKPNPRLLHRLGTLIAAQANSDDFRMAASDWDVNALDGFTAEHVELMRLYFREALAKAQQVEALPMDDGASEEITADDFFQAADAVGSVRTPEGEPVFDEDIATLLRDIGGEVRDLSEAIQFTMDERRKEVLRRRRRQAIKNGSIYVGRVLFFSAFFIVALPGTFGVAGSIASILGVAEILAPGSVRSIYSRLQAAFPILPSLPASDRDENDRDGKSH
ncbi:hypothetical protein [Hasllibacter halocynthiae]|uniref:hypothetical protein n=1 Tax=Hasllibacter halocynthiae TaxID=595589 RepID=UPI0011B27DCB|nr:hypothetical protein [Hasllibacter halocynthiae]